MNKNFGCGSSREHAPQPLKRWGKGIKAIVGESFAEIFFGNCVSLGIPCAVVDAATIERTMSAVERDPKSGVVVSLENKTVLVGNESFAFEMGEGVRQQFLEARWDTTAELLANKDAVVAAARKLPYFSDWS